MLRLTVYDSPEHDFPYVEATLSTALSISADDAFALAERIHFNGFVSFGVPDLSTAEGVVAKILDAGPDPRSADSKGSLVVSLEAVEGDDVRVLKRGRVRKGEFEPMDLAAVEAFLGGHLSEYNVEPDPGTAILEVTGQPLPLWLQTGSVIALGAALVLAGAIAVSNGVFPWLHDGRGAPSSFALLLVFGVFMVPVFALLVLRVPRTGRVVFYEDHVAFCARGAMTSAVYARVPWTDLRAFRDGDSEFVQVLPSKSRIRDPFLTIPTPTEADRAGVLALLLRKGVPRDEA